jgi:BlaI family transcriptional regulator, penicillinase repressor
MARKRSEVLTPAEQRIMRVVWERGEASVGDVVEAISRQAPVAYTTAMTVLKVLESKGYVAAERRGRAFVYRPKVSRDEAQSQALGHLLRQFFDGSSTALAHHVLRRQDIGVDELEQLKAEVDAAIASRGSHDD